MTSSLPGAGAPREGLTVFARAPRLGKVKTRLSPPLTPEQALVLHRALVEDTLERLALVSRPGLEHRLYLSEPLEDPRDLQPGPRWKVGLQAPGNLGARLEVVFREAFGAGLERMVVLGSDSPTVPLERVHGAFEELRAHDAALGPARDGGYYLLGCSRFLPELFRDISWGNPQVLEETIGALSRAGRRFKLLEEWYDRGNVHRQRHAA
ncbi:MAG: TIGR04282 family arsenosugar biosynthesis glycosyltransferase, partial [Acidobacteriota bacterium]